MHVRERHARTPQVPGVKPFFGILPAPTEEDKLEEVQSQFAGISCAWSWCGVERSVSECGACSCVSVGRALCITTAISGHGFCCVLV